MKSFTMIRDKIRLSLTYFTKYYGLTLFFIFGSILSVNSQVLPGFKDGNVLSDGELDWEDVFYEDQGTNLPNLPANSIFSFVFDDKSVLPVDRTFTQGSKDDQFISQWTNSDKDPNDKTNIQQAGAFLYDGVLYFFGNLYADNGDANIGFWFFQDEVGVDGTKFTGEHLPGDIFIVAAFSNGGNIENIAAYQWLGDGTGDVPNSSNNLQTLIPANDTENPLFQFIGAVVNLSPASTPSGWDYYTKGEAGPSDMPPLTFFEGYIDLKGLATYEGEGSFDFAGPLCFSSFMVNTRTSTSVDAELKDFVGDGFPVTPIVEVDDETICEGESVTLTPEVTGGLLAQGQEDFEYEWYLTGADPDTDDPEFTTKTITFDEETPAGVYVYDLYVIGDAIDGLGKCRSEPETVTVTVVAAPELSNETDDFCYDEQEDTLLSSYNEAIGAEEGDVVVWYDNAAKEEGDIVTSTGGELAAGQDHIFYATVTNEDDCSSEAMLTITIYELPDLSDETDEFCYDDQVDTPLSGYNTAIGAEEGDVVVWYNDAAKEEADIVTSTGGNLASGQDHIFYATVTNENDCSADATLTITIFDVPVLSNETDEFCYDEQEDTVLSGYNEDIGAGEGDVVVWFDDEAMEEEDIVTSTGGELAVGDHVFYAIVTNSNDCDSEATLTISILPVPDLSDESDAFCFEGQLDKDLSDYNTAIGAGENDDVVWYDDEAKENADIVTSTGGDLSVGTHYFYATVTNDDGCDSEAVLTIVVDDTVEAGTGSTDRFCYGDSSKSSVNLFDLLSGEDEGGDWEDTDASGADISDPEDVDFTTIPAGSYTFTYTINPPDGSQCESDSAEVEIIIDPVPDTPAITKPPLDCFATTGSFIVTSGTEGLEFKLDDGDWTAYPDGGYTNVAPGPHTLQSRFISTECESGVLNFDIDEPLDSPLDPVVDAIQPTCEVPTGTIIVTSRTTDLLFAVLLTSELNGEIPSEAFVLYPEGGFSGLAPGEYAVFAKSFDDCLSGQTTITLIEPICEEFEGCTLGYWKNHTDQWCDEYLTCTTYGSVFDIPSDSELYNLSLLEVLNLNGGGIYNLGRQSVAALLNACSDVNFELATTADVIAYVSANYMNADEAGSYLDMLNQAGCPLGGTRATTAPSVDCPDESGFTISPVPFKDEMTITYHFDSVNVTIQIFDMRGHLVMTTTDSDVSAGDMITFDTNFVKGNQMYIVKVITDSNTYTESAVSSNK